MTKPGATQKEKTIVEALLRERSGTPDRVLAELDRVKPLLKRLVEGKVSIKDILNRFIKGGLETRVTASQARAYIKENFDYPASRAPRATKATKATKAKKARKTTKKATKKAAR